jgi:hypothetical protein
MSGGQAENGDRLAQRTTGAPLSFDPLKRSLEKMVEG